jgi:hypothetical protein
MEQNDTNNKVIDAVKEAKSQVEDMKNQTNNDQNETKKELKTEDQSFKRLSSKVNLFNDKYNDLAYQLPESIQKIIIKRYTDRKRSPLSLDKIKEINPSIEKSLKTHLNTYKRQMENKSAKVNDSDLEVIGLNKKLGDIDLKSIAEKVNVLYDEKQKKINKKKEEQKKKEEEEEKIKEQKIDEDKNKYIEKNITKIVRPYKNDELKNKCIRNFVMGLVRIDFDDDDLEYEYLDDEQEGLYNDLFNYWFKKSDQLYKDNK